jgi:hypothetical protein
MVLWVAAACATGKAGSGGGTNEGASFRVFYPDQPADGFRAQVGKRFIVKPVATCTYDNGRDARWSMTGARAEGELPEGFTIEEGTIAGTPKAPGSWTIRVRFTGVTCAGEPHDEVVVPVMITAR